MVKKSGHVLPTSKCQRFLGSGLCIINQAEISTTVSNNGDNNRGWVSQLPIVLNRWGWVSQLPIGLNRWGWVSQLHIGIMMVLGVPTPRRYNDGAGCSNSP